jgi:hypothetical protein
MDCCVMVTRAVGEVAESCLDFVHLGMCCWLRKCHVVCERNW